MAKVSEKFHEFLVTTEKPSNDADRAAKKNYAEKLSRFLAWTLADALREDFPSVLPKADGSYQESRAGSAKGLKKLDVNVSTPELGLALGISIKTISFPDPQTKKFTKNYTRNDMELRAEASDYHVRQPYSVLIGILFLPIDACLDANERSSDPLSSFAKAVRHFSSRAGRKGPSDSVEKFEGFFVALYEAHTDECWLKFFDVESYKPPRFGRPKPESGLSTKDFLEAIKMKYEERNVATYEFDEPTEEE